MKIKAKVRLKQDENKPVEVKLKKEYIDFANKDIFKNFSDALNGFEKIQRELSKLGGKKNMIVMISQPMDGKTNEQIHREREEVIKKFNDLHIDVIDSIIEETADSDIYNEYHPVLFYMAKSIDFMARVDAVYFMPGWEKARGCRVERNICEEYNIKILEESFFTQSHTVTLKPDNYGFGITTTKNY